MIALLASPPLLTPLHIQLQAFFFCSPSIQARRQEGGFGAKPGRDGGVRDPGQSPGPKTLNRPASRPTEGPRWLGTTSGQEGGAEAGGLSSGHGNGQIKTFLENQHNGGALQQGARTHTHTQALFRLVHVTH